MSEKLKKNVKSVADSLKKEYHLPWYVVGKEIEGTKVIQFERLAGDLTKFLSTNFLKVIRTERFHPVKRPEDLKNSKDVLKKLLGY